MENFAKNIHQENNLSEVKRALYKRVHSQEPSGLWEADLYDDPDVKKIIDKIIKNKEKKISDSTLSYSLLDGDGQKKLQEFLGEDQFSVKAALDHRRRFDQLRQALGALHKAFKNLEEADKEALSEGRKFSSRFKKSSLDLKPIGENPVVLPFFEDEDIHIVDLLTELSNDYKPNEKPSLRVILDSHKAILNDLGSEKKTVEDKLYGKDAQIGKYTSACRKLEKFFEEEIK